MFLKKFANIFIIVSLFFIFTVFDYHFVYASAENIKWSMEPRDIGMFGSFSEPNFSEGLIPFTYEDNVNSNWGYMDKTGNIILPPQFYASHNNFYDGLAVIHDPQSKNYGYIDKLGNIVVKPIYRKAYNFSEGMASVLDSNNRYGYIDISGKKVIKSQFTQARKFSEGLAVVSLDNNKYGYIDKTGNVMLDYKYTSAGNFSEGFAYVEYQDSSNNNKKIRGYIKKNGELLVSGLISGGREFSKGFAVVYNSDGSKSYYVDSNGKFYSCPYMPSDFSEGLARVSIYKGKDYTGFIDTASNLVIPMKFNFAGDFSEGLAWVLTFDGLYGYIDKTGNYVIQPQFDNAGSFSEGVAAVKTTDGKWGIIQNPLSSVRELVIENENNSENNWKIYVDNALIKFDVPPVNINGRLLVPIREITEALGSHVDWDDKTKSVIIQRGLDTIIMNIDNPNLYNTKKLNILDVEPQIINSKTMIPVRALAEILNANVNVNGKVVTIICNPINDELIISDFSKKGFAKFDYFGNVFLSKHGNTKYAFSKVLSDLGDWTKLVTLGKVKNYQKDIFKANIVEILESPYIEEKPFDNKTPLIPDYMDELSKYFLDTGDLVEFVNKKNEQIGNADIASLKKLDDAMGKYGKIIKVTKLTTEQLKYLFSNYTENARFLSSMKNTMSIPLYYNKDMNDAIDELQFEYAHKFLTVWGNIEDKLIDESIEYIIKSVNLNVSIAIFASETLSKLGGLKDYSDNVENAVAIMPIANNLMWYYQDLFDSHINITTGKISKKIDQNTWNEIVSMFYITKAGMLEGYQFMINVTDDDIEKLYLDKQKQVLRNIHIKNEVPSLGEYAFIITK